MNRCTKCLIPDTRPDTAFVDGVCSACITHESRNNIDWNARKQDLITLLDRHDGRCLVPSSGGKDSTFQCMTLKELGADVTAVTATTCMLTEIGRKNIESLSRHVRTVTYTPNQTVRAKLNRLGLTLVGDISWPEHVAIFTTPFKAALDLKIPLIFYGENPQAQYGGPLGAEESVTMTRRWVSEFGGFLGLRPSDMIGNDGITERDMSDYMPPSPFDIDAAKVDAHFLGQYVPWNSRVNAQVAKDSGMLIPELPPTKANVWNSENLDNLQTGLHDHAMYRKYGYGRGCAQISVDVRNGILSRDDALAWVELCDGLFPETYMSVHVGRVLQHIGMTHEKLMETLDKFTNWDLFDGVANGGKPVFK